MVSWFNFRASCEICGFDDFPDTVFVVVIREERTVVFCRTCARIKGLLDEGHDRAEGAQRERG